jgi:hypothetical protein
MAQPLSPPALPGQLHPPRKFARGAIIAGAALGFPVLLGVLMLWAHYVTGVFFEMIASGISACF